MTPLRIFFVLGPKTIGLSQVGGHDKAVVVVPKLLPLHGAVLILLVKTALVLLVTVAEHIRYWKGKVGSESVVDRSGPEPLK